MNYLYNLDINPLLVISFVNIISHSLSCLSILLMISFIVQKLLSLIRSHILLFSKTHHWPQDWKRSVFIPIPKKDNAKKCSNYRTIALTSHASKVMLKIFQARLQQYVNHELPDVQAGFRKGRGTRDQIANIHWITE